jgi:protoporphyrinogen oxidase
MARILVLGAGPMGLAAAHRAVGLGHEVDLLEAGAVAGGMAAHFDFDGTSIERFYHFVCRSDAPTFALMEELGIGDRMCWMPTSMGYLMGGRVHRWGDPLALLAFPHLGLVSKIRTGLQMFVTTRARDFAAIEHLTAREWLEHGSGRTVYETLWRRLMDLKFHELADGISASWIATRIRRIGTSRRSIFQEELGYIQGGSETLVQALVQAIEAKGGRIHLGDAAAAVETKGGHVVAVRTESGRRYAADAVICTVPVQLVPELVPDLPQAAKDAYAAIPNMGVVCLLFRLARPVTRHFWVNIVDPEIPIPGIIEFSNLRPLDGTFVYVPYYMPTTNSKWSWGDDAFVAEAFAAIRRVNPTLTDGDLRGVRVGRLRYAQPVCGPDFLAKLPPVQTAIGGLQVADTCFYYPEDRGIAESVRMGRRMAEDMTAKGPVDA